MSNNIQSLAVLQEASFGSLSSNFPDISIFDGSEKSVPIVRGSLSTPGDVQMNADESVRRGFFRRPADVATTVDSSGNLRQRRKGQLTVTIPALQAGGSGDSDNYWLSWFLGSSLVDDGAPVVTEEAVTGASASLLNVGLFSNYRVGQMVSTALVDQRAEYAAIVDRTDDVQDTIQITPAFSGAMAGENLHVLRTFGGIDSSAGSSLAFRIDGVKYRTYAFGCRMSSFKITANNTRAQGEFTFDCALIFDTHEAVVAGGNWLETQDITDSKVLNTLDCEFIVSDAINTGAGGYPTVAGRNSLDVEGITVTLKCELTPCPSMSSILGMSDLIVTNRTIQVDVMTCDIGTTFQRDLLDKVHRNLVVGFGPEGQGEGMCVFLPAAHLIADPSRSNSWKQTLSFREVDWTGDVGTRAASNLIRTPFRIAFGVTA